MREGSQLAAVTYELGIARTLGKPLVVLAKEGQVIPFDIDIEATLLSGSTQDSIVISEAMDLALVWMMPRPRESGVSQTIDQVLATYPLPHANVYVDQTLKQLKKLKDDPDPVLTTAALNTLIEYLDEDLMLLHPVWSPNYPRVGETRIFHVMPFRTDWADSVADCVERVCRTSRTKYIRGDRVKEANIIRSIWDEINKASHIVVDLTGFNANVALELGLAHTLGRPTLLVGQGDTKDHLYPMIAKERIASYTTDKISDLGKAVREFLT